MLKRLLFWFLGFNFVILLFFEIFYWLAIGCSYPIGFGFTVLGYFLNIFGMIVIATAAGMMLAMMKKKENYSSRILLLILFFSFWVETIVFYFQLKGDLEYIAFITIPTLLLCLPVYVLGKKKLA